MVKWWKGGGSNKNKTKLMLLHESHLSSNSIFWGHEFMPIESWTPPQSTSQILKQLFGDMSS